MNMSLGILKVTMHGFQLDPAYIIASSDTNSASNGTIDYIVVQVSLVGNSNASSERNDLVLVAKSVSKIAAMPKAAEFALSSSGSSGPVEFKADDKWFEFKADDCWFVNFDVGFATSSGNVVSVAPVILPINKKEYQKQKIGLVISSNLTEYLLLKSYGLQQRQRFTSNLEQVSIGTLAISVDFAPNRQSFRGLAASLLEERIRNNKIEIFESQSNESVVEEVLHELSSVLGAVDEDTMNANDRMLLRLDLTCFEQMCTHESMSSRFAEYLRSAKISEATAFRSLFKDNRSSMPSSAGQTSFQIPASMPAYQVSSKIMQFLTVLQLNLPNASLLNTDLMEKLLAIFSQEVSKSGEHMSHDSEDFETCGALFELPWHQIITFTVTLCVWYLQQSLISCCLAHGTNILRKVLTVFYCFTFVVSFLSTFSDLCLIGECLQELDSIRDIFMRYDGDASGQIMGSKLGNILTVNI
jgi:hypothetical protein